MTHHFGVFGGGAALALAAALSLGQVALADGTHGQTGNYLFTDDSTHRTICHLSNSTNNPNSYWLSKVTVPAPSVWWPDTDSNNNTQHGKVGWRFTLQNDHGSGTTWHTVAKSVIQKKTAYEDSQSPYNTTNGTRAPFTKLSVTTNGHNQPMTSGWRVIVRVNWYRPDGSIMGYATHTVFYYFNKAETRVTEDTTGYCLNNITFV